MSIRYKITLITIAAILTTILSVFAVSYLTLKGENERQSVEKMNLIAKDTENSLEKYLDSIEQSVEMVGNLASESLDSVILVENGGAGSNAGPETRTPDQEARLDAYLAAYCDRLQETFASVANHTQGAVTYYYCLTPEISSNEHGFFYSRVGRTGFDERESLDARELDPEDKEHTIWYYGPIKRGRPSWVGPYKAHFLSELWTYSYIMPIYRSGTLIGVLGVDIPFETLVSQVASIKVYETGFACLFDEEGRVLYHPDLEEGVVPDIQGVSSFRDLIRQEDSGDDLIRFKYEGEEMQMCYTTLSSGLKLVIAAPVREINASWIRLTRNILLVTLAFVVIFAALILFVMGIITRPLVRLTAASQRLADADYDVELNYKGRDEIGVLTVAFSRMRDQLKSYISDLNRQATTDAMTGLPNMKTFLRLAEVERKRLLLEGRHPATIFINLVDMKHFNRQYGMNEGDRLICEVAEILARYFGRYNLCHIGQDHFAAETEEEHLEEKLGVIFRECQKANHGNSLPIRVGIYPDRLEAAQINVACDRAKYACDQLRGSYISAYYYFDKSMIRQVENVRYIINHLDQALSEHWIKAFYQPIIRASNGKICDEEALARWIDPNRGLLPPDEFIPILEKARLIYKLDLYMLDEILKKMKTQKEKGMPMVPQSLNLSRADFDSCDIVEEICWRVDAAGVPREKLTIEVTESMVGRNFGFMKSQIERFQTLGFRVWMDDFGSGYSALDMLQDIHFDLLKFDMRFMHRFDEGKESRVILTELLRMANQLGIDTVCEGVETKEQAEFLREAGCGKLQGYYFSKPITFEEILDYKLNGSNLEFEEGD